MSDSVTKLNSRDKFKVAFYFLMVYPLQTIPVMSLYDKINDETNSSLIELLVLLLWRHWSPVLSHTSQTPKKLRTETTQHQSIGGRVSNSRKGISWWLENDPGLCFFSWQRGFRGGGAATQLLLLDACVPVCKEEKSLPLLLINCR